MTTPAWQQKLVEAFAPIHLDIRDDSHRHRHHAEAQTHGGGHYTLTMVSAAFKGMPSLKRHRAIYAVLADELSHKKIHALALKTYSPEEWQNQ